jgi:cyclopropane fatty-acyl-phospholipid synthase-like methyltransferase
MKPWSEACERNRDPILSVLREVLAGARTVLEIGSGTGQHAVYFAQALPHLAWQTSDLPENHPGMRLWIEESGLPNLRPPLALDVDGDAWPAEPVDAIFTANTLHIMSRDSVGRLFAGADRGLVARGALCIYGPFNYRGRFTSPSNEAFDAMLRQRAPRSGLRDFEDICALGVENGLLLEADHPMPANNRLLVFRRTPAA